MSRIVVYTALLPALLGARGLEAQERRWEAQGGVLQSPGPAHRDPSLDANGMYVGLRFSESVGTRRRFLLTAGAARTGGTSSYTAERYSSYSIPVTGGLGFALRRTAPTVEIALHAGLAREWLTLPEGRTSEQMFGSTDAAGAHWNRFLASELLVRHSFSPRLPAISLAARLHHGAELSPRPSVGFLLGVSVPR